MLRLAHLIDRYISGGPPGYHCSELGSRNESLYYPSLSIDLILYCLLFWCVMTQLLTVDAMFDLPPIYITRDVML